MLRTVDAGLRFPKGLFLAEAETRVRWLKPEDALLVVATMPAPFGSMARLAAITVMRLSEIHTLRREQVDLAQGGVTLPRTRTEPRQVVLSAEAQGILALVFEATTGGSFPIRAAAPTPRSQVYRVWHTAAQAAGLTDFHFHDLRHHGATMAWNAGFSSSMVMGLDGWTNQQMMRRSAAVTDPTLRAAAEVVSGDQEWQQTRNSALLRCSRRP